MTVHLLSYASPAFAGQQRLNSFTGRKFGCDLVHAHSVDDIEPSFAEQHRGILEAPRGAGFWLWKPYFLHRALAQMEESDLLIYADAATAFIAPVQQLEDRMNEQRVDLLIAGEGFCEREFTRRDAFVLMESDSPAFTDTPHRFASVLVFRPSEWSRRFVNEWLQFACDPRILTDQANQCGLDNYPEFTDHRHDQSIFSLLSKKHRIPVSNRPFLCDDEEPRPDYVLCHYRQRRSAAQMAALLLARGVLQTTDLGQLV